MPSTFFIGDSGVPLEISGGFLDVAALVEKIETVLQVSVKIEYPKIPLCVICVHSYTNIL